MPSYNAAKYLPACLDSIIAQSYKNWELLVVNDFSTDQTAHILNDYAAKDKRIKVLENTEKGIIPALQLAYKNSTGAFITRMDADDIMAKDKLKLLRQVLVGKTNTVATGFVKYIAENGVGEGYKNYEQWLNKLTAAENNFSDIYKECVIPSPSWMMTRQSFENIGDFNTTVYPEDYDLCFRMYQHQFNVVGVKEIIHFWRDYGERTSRNDENYSDNTFLTLKCRYFLKIDYNKRKKIILWGAGTKGKRIAKYLLKYEIPFTWVCENESKIGHHIYGKIMENAAAKLHIENAQFLVCVANSNDKKEIAEKLEKQDDVFYFA